MFLKLLDFFINKGVFNKPDLLFRFRFLVSLLLLFIFFDLVAALLYHSSLLQDSFNYLIFFCILVGIIITIKLSDNIRLASFLFIIFSICLNLSAINASGGIYSYNIKWLMAIILFAIIFNYRPNSKIPIFYVLFAIVATVCFYVIESQDYRNDFDNLLKYKKIDFLIENVLYFIVFSTIIIFYYLSHNKLLKEVYIKNDILKQQYKLNLAKTKELNTTKEKLEETNRDLKSYAFVTSHDLKEPLRTITSFSQLLKMELSDKHLSKEASQYLNFIEQGSKRMFNLVEDALELSKIDNIKRDSFEQIDLNLLLNEVLFNLNNQIKNTNATIQFEKMPPIRGSYVALQHLFQNLISNGLKFTKESTAPIISINTIVKNNEYVFSVKDNGIGINAEKLKAIFEPYSRIDKTIAGTGLGLAICKKIIKLHDGKIWAETNETGGTVFQFTLPVA